jgi:Sec-independent protein translocase protein TatA
MELFGIGPLELLFILLIALIILGPGDMVKAGLTLGRFLRKIITSPEWRTVQKASQELRNLPNRLMREASLDDLSKDLADINKIGGELNSDIKKVELDLSPWTTPPQSSGLNTDQSVPQESINKTMDLPNVPDPPNHDK